MPNFTCTERVDCDCVAGLSAELADCQGATGPAGPLGADGLPGVQTYIGTYADPNGFVEGNLGDFFKNSDTGELWTKSTQGTALGWI